MTDGTSWRRCNACKEPIALGAIHFVCSVSTCNRKRTGLVFCSTSCWEVHLPTANHRKAWALERTAPTRPDAEEAPATERKPKRTLVRPASSTKSTARAEPTPREVLIIASRLKDYVRAVSGFNTSERVLGPLSEIVRNACDEAIRNAAKEGRKTILDRDVPDA